MHQTWYWSAQDFVEFEKGEFDVCLAFMIGQLANHIRLAVNELHENGALNLRYGQLRVQSCDDIEPEDTCDAVFADALAHIAHMYRMRNYFMQRTRKIEKNKALYQRTQEPQDTSC